MTPIATISSSVLDWRLRLLLFLARRLGLTFQVVAQSATEIAVLLSSTQVVAAELANCLFFDALFKNAIEQDRAEQHLPPPAANIRTQKGVH